MRGRASVSCPGALGSALSDRARVVGISLAVKLCSLPGEAELCLRVARCWALLKPIQLIRAGVAVSGCSLMPIMPMILRYRWIVEARLSEAEWRSGIAEIADRRRALSADVMPQDRFELGLALLWRAMQNCPPPVRNAFDGLQEGRISALSRPRAEALGRSEAAAWAPDVSINIDRLVLEVTAEIRALDKALDEVRVSTVRGGDPNIDFLAFGDETVFVLPWLHGDRLERRAGQSFDRRALIHNRVLPVEADGLPVRLYTPAVRGPGAGGGAADAVSAVFRNVELQVGRSEDGGNFWIEGMNNADDVQADLEVQLGELLTGQAAMAVMWPELTIPPPLLKCLRSALAVHGLADTPVDLGFVVAGSWHEDRPGGRINAAQVLSTSGRTLFEVLKRERYELEPGVLEAITPGGEIPVLVYGDVLIAFGICKDFCERRRPTPYRELDVDYVMTPSLGNAVTMEEHEIAAGSLRVGYGTRGFVVQQMLGAPWGMVLGPASQPRGRARGTAQNKLLARTTISCTIA